MGCFELRTHLVATKEDKLHTNLNYGEMNNSVPWEFDVVEWGRVVTGVLYVEVGES